MTDSFSYKLNRGTLLQHRYRIDAVLGEGGFGITYKAFDILLEIPVAIKEYYPQGYAMRDGSSSARVTVSEAGKNADIFMQWKERFLNEARVLAKCSSIPFIVVTHNFFEENDTAYIVMEYLDGKTLKRCVKEDGVMDGRELAELIVPLLGSLEMIHNRSLLHRDISPENIMLMPDNTLKLYDFGAARTFDLNSQKSMSVVLKHGYAPPEQYRTHGEQGPWTDIYAFSATLYFCLTGVTPESSIDRLLDNGKIVRPSDSGRITPVDREFEDIILKGLSIRPEDRYLSAGLMRDAVRNYLQNKSTPKEIVAVEEDMRTVLIPEVKKAEPSEERRYDAALSTVLSEESKAEEEPEMESENREEELETIESIAEAEESEPEEENEDEELVIAEEEPKEKGEEVEVTEESEAESDADFDESADISCDEEQELSEAVHGETEEEAADEEQIIPKEETEVAEADDESEDELLALNRLSEREAVADINVSDETEQRDTGTDSFEDRSDEDHTDMVADVPLKKNKKITILGIIATVMALTILLVGILKQDTVSFFEKEPEIGDIVTFGTYQQSKEGNDDTPIKWIVLDNEDDKFLLFSKDLIDIKDYDSSGNNRVTWETSTLREWLNITFYNTAFTPDEKDYVVKTKVPADRVYNSDIQGNDTIDHVFLMSREEFDKYYVFDTVSKNYTITRFALNKAEKFTSTMREFGNYWLRTIEEIYLFDGDEYTYASTLNYYQYDYYDHDTKPTVFEQYVAVEDYGVRPCIWVRFPK